MAGEEDGSTTTTVDTTTTAAPTSTDAGSGATSTAAPAPDTTTTTDTTSGAEPTDMLSAVRAVLKPTAEPSPAAGSGAGEPGTQSGDQPQGGADTTATSTTTTTQPPPELTEADFADVDKPSVKKRIETLLSQRAAARTETETMREPAQQWNQHVEFLQTNGITPQQAQDLYGVGALLARGDFTNFLAAVEPYVQAARAAVGLTLPEDLQRRVDEGGLAQEDASELARTRAAAADATRRVTMTDQQRAQAAEAARSTSVRDTLAQWEQGVVARDPDFAHKREPLRAYMLAIKAERGLPPDAATARQWADEALAGVNKVFTSARPPASATPARPSSVAPATKALPEPRTMKEAIAFALQRSQAA
jgi:hypothetical protein